MSLVKTLGAELDQKRAEMHQLFDSAKTGKIDPQTGAPIFDMTAQQAEEIRQRESELAELEEKYQAARLADVYNRNLDEIKGLHEPQRRYPTAAGTGNGASSSQQRDSKTLSELVFESREYKGRGVSPRRWGVELPDVDVKTLLETTAGFAPANNRGSRVVLSAQRRPVVADLIPTDTTTDSLIRYMKEKTFTNMADSVSEGAEKPESALEYEEASSPVVKIATWIPVTEEQLDDVAQMRNLLDNRLTLMLQLVEEEKLLTGPGGADIEGFYTVADTQAQAADDMQDAVFKAMQKVRWTGFAEPSGVVIHPDDWTPIRLARTDNGGGPGTGDYIWGPPSAVGPETLWGKPIIVTPAANTGSPLTGDFVLYAHISRKMGIRIDVSNSHEDYFVFNKLAVRAEMRESLEIYRDTAFVYVN